MIQLNKEGAPMTRVILISGKQGSGKTTLSHNLTELLFIDGFKPVNVKFADVLYEMHDSVWNIMKKYGKERKTKKDGPLLQLLGTEWGRGTQGENIWVNIAKYRTQKLLEDPKTIVIIDDCRFPNELAAFPQAYKIRLEASAELRKERCEAWRDNDSHPSETSLDDSTGFDKIYNAAEKTSLEIADEVSKVFSLMMTFNK